MEVYEALTLLRDKAARDVALRKSLLETRHSRTPLSDFCRISMQAGVELYVIMEDNRRTGYFLRQEKDNV